MWWGLHMWATIVDWSCRNRQKTTFLVIFSHFPHSIDKSQWDLSILWGKWDKMTKKVVFWRFWQLQSTIVAHMCSPHHIWCWKLGKGYLKSFPLRYFGHKPHINLGGSKKPFFVSQVRCWNNYLHFQIFSFLTIFVSVYFTGLYRRHANDVDMIFSRFFSIFLKILVGQSTI